MLEGLPPNNAAHVMRLTCDEDIARRVADIIVETFDPAETAAAAFEDEGASPRQDWRPGQWTVEAYFGQAPDEAQIRDLVACAAGPVAAAALSFARIETRDWVASSLAGLRSVRAGRFLLHGGHDRAAARANDIAIEIEAALAFGTGHHGSTRGCLLALDRLAKRKRPNAILDVGTGSGVLAIAAAKLFRLPVQAGDIDPVAVAAATANARLNGVAGLVRPVVARGLGHPALQAGAPYDLVFANILARPLRKLAPAIAALLAEDGEIILSGLLGCDVAGVVSAYRAQGLALTWRLDIEGWATLMMRSGGARG
ncbi:MAG: 50S ribosomal protein L11 methyltransferase [Methylovirgula sp.]